MKKFFIILFLTAFSSAHAGGHLSEKDKKAALKCTGLYYANSMIPQGTLELDKIVYSISAKKFLTSCASKCERDDGRARPSAWSRLKM